MKHFLALLSICCLLMLSCEQPVEPAAPLPVIDRTPIVTFLWPDSGAVVTGNIQVTASATALDSVMFVTFAVDGPVIGVDSSEFFSVIWHAGFWADDSLHRLTATATDSLGRTGSDFVDVTVAASTTVATFQSIDPYWPTTLFLNVSDGVRLTSAQFFIDGDLIGADTSAPFTCRFNPAFWADNGVHTFTATVVDSAGRTGRALPVQRAIPADVMGHPNFISHEGHQVVENLNQTFVWVGSEGAVNYDLEVSPLSDFSMIEFATTTADSLVPVTLQERSIYYLRVRARNSLNRTTQWSSTDIATIQTFRSIIGGSGIDEGRAVTIAPDNGIVVAQRTEPNGLMAMKVDTRGQLVWNLLRGGNFDGGFGIRTTSDGGSVIAGYMYDPTAGQFVVLKLTSLGGQQWLKRFRWGHAEHAWDVTPTYDGGYLAGGFYMEMVSGKQHMLLVRLSSSGDSLWSRSFHPALQTEAKFVAELSDHGFLAYGSAAALATDSIDSRLPADLLLVRTNAQGDSLWTRIFGNGEEDTPGGMFPTDDGGCIIAWSTIIPGTYMRESSVSKRDAMGNEVWKRTYAVSGRGETTTSLAPHPSGGFVIAGHTSDAGNNDQRIFIRRLDDNGNTMWLKEYSPSPQAFGYGVTVAPDGGIVVVGYWQNDTVIMKTDPRGRVVPWYY